MTELAVEVVDVRPELYAASPHLLFRLRLQETSGEVVHAMVLRCQLRVEPQRRHYDPEERAGLVDLFGTADRYASTLKPFLWTHATAVVQGFTGETTIDLPVACSYDLDVSTGKYLHALHDGDVPLILLFSGTVFTRGATGFAVEQLSWSLEAPCRLPVATWRSLMDAYFPGGGWLRLDRETIDALLRYRSARGLTSWEATIADLLPAEVTAP
ncbi:MAG: hypothetical protein JWM48_564 [Mycobacterium sp.]|nr:hypothetical protein [Mycobacterium sp.]